MLSLSLSLSITHTHKHTLCPCQSLLFSFSQSLSLSLSLPPPPPPPPCQRPRRSIRYSDRSKTNARGRNPTLSTASQSCLARVDRLPSHLRPCLTRPNSISPQKSQKWGDLYEWTNSRWGRICSSSMVAWAAHTRAHAHTHARTHARTNTHTRKHTHTNTHTRTSQ